MSQEISHEEAVRIDTQLADLWQEEAEAHKTISSYATHVASLIGLESKGYGGKYSRTRYYSETTEEIVALAEVKLQDETFVGYNRSQVMDSLPKIAIEQARAKSAREAAQPLEAIYAEHRWSRFFLVKNNNGHIHSSMNCSTCYDDTLFGWLPTLSGLTEAEAVEEHGSILCSVCYPSAPVEWTNGISKQAQAEKDARAAAKAEREAAKAAKAITNPDGSPIRFEYGTVRTLVSARRELVAAFKDRLYYPSRAQHYYEWAVVLATAIAHKTGEDQEELLIQAEYKADKLVAKERA